MDHKRSISGVDPDEKAQEGCSPMAKKDALVYNSRSYAKGLSPEMLIKYIYTYI